MAPTPSHMKAIVISQNGGPEVLYFDEDFPVPTLKDSEVLVKTKYSAVNYIDTHVREGRFPASGFPLVPGYEGVGTVVEVKGHNPQELKEGDDVIWWGLGAYAEYCTVPAENVVRLPTDVSHEDALGSFLIGLTALSFVKETYEVKSGDTILVHAAAGGTGLLFCQVLRSIGATVIGTASTAEKCELAKRHGATHTINYAEYPDWVSKVKEIVPSGVDCVFDSVGKSTWEGSLEAVRLNGSVIYFGSASGPIPPLDLRRLTQKNTKIMCASAMHYLTTGDQVEYYSNLLFEHLRNGTIMVNIHKIYDLKDVQQAHQDIEGRSTTGKLLLKVPE